MYARPLAGTLRVLPPVTLARVRRTPQEGLYDPLLAEYHSLGQVHGVGEQVNYLAYLGFTPATRAPATVSPAGRRRCAGRSSMDWRATPAS